MTRRGSYDAQKRVLDVTLAAVTLLVTAPVQLVAAVVIAARLGRPVLFRQVRPGRGGGPFTLVKFRSMRDVDEPAGLVTDAQRLTRLGRVLRSTSVDELPSLVNVLKGDMSLVGPRPLRMSYLPRYNARQAKRHDVRPGLTGLAQVRGRNWLSWEERFELDLEYVESRSHAMDLKILLWTLVAVVRRSGISAPGEATMTPFLGTGDGTATGPRGDRS